MLPIRLGSPLISGFQCYAALGRRTPNALIARSFTMTGLRSPVAATLTIDLAISRVVGSSRLSIAKSISENRWRSSPDCLHHGRLHFS